MSRICIVTHVVAPWDGQGRVNYELARHLLTRGHHVTLVASVVDSILAREAGIRWIHIPVPRWLPDPVQWVLFALLVRLRLGPHTLTQFDIVHLHGAIAPIQADLNTCHFVHASWLREAPPALGPLQRLVTTVCAWTERRAYRTARRVVAVSDAVGQALRETVGVPRGHLRVIYTGVDPEEFRPRQAGEPRQLHAELALPETAFIVLFIGDARSPRKNLDLALSSLARLGQDFHLVVIGETRGGPYLERAAQLGVERRTHFLGARRDVAACLRDADALLCVSHYEPASLVLLEGMASGLPVICTPGLGNGPFVDHGANGFRLRSAGDRERATWLLETLARHPDLRQRVGDAARATASQLTWSQMARRYESLYLELQGELAPAGPAYARGAPGLRSVEGRA